MPIPDGIEVVEWRQVPVGDVRALCGAEMCAWLSLVSVPHAA